MPDDTIMPSATSSGLQGVVVAPTMVTEGEDAGVALSLVLRDVVEATGTVDLTFVSNQSTVTNGADVLVPSYSGTYSVSQSSAGDYTFDLPIIAINADLAREGTETLSVQVHAPGVVFANGTDTTVVNVDILDHVAPADPVQAAIDSIYILTSGQPATPQELNYWGSQIATGQATPASLASSLFAQPLGQEHTADVVMSIYEQALGRAATADEISAWQRVTTGEGNVDAALSSVMSDPGSVSRLLGATINYGYHELSGRDATPVELSKWAHLLSGDLDPSASRVPHLQDFNSDGHADFLWQNKATGEITTWDTLGSNQFNLVLPNAYAQSGIDSHTTITGQFDFNGDGGSDLLLRQADGSFSISTSTGTGFTVGAYTCDTVSSNWHIAATGDFNADGRDDLIFRNANGGMTEWQSTGTGFTENTYVNNDAAHGQVLVGAMDMNGDGRDDLVFRNPDTGAFSVWNATPDGFQQDSYTDNSVGTDWSIAALADMNGDGKGDLVWRNTSDGTITEWLSEGDHFATNALIEHGVSLDQQLVQATDFNGDGMADLTFRDVATGRVSVWESTADHSLIQDAFTIDNVTTDWTLIGAHGSLLLM